MVSYFVSDVFPPALSIFLSVKDLEKERCMGLPVRISDCMDAGVRFELGLQ